MKKFKNVGFTLIELLAIIIVLGIVALIAIPTVNNVLSDAKFSSFKTSVKSISNKIIDNCESEIINGKKITQNYTIKDGIISPKLGLDGDLPNGSIEVTKDCELTYTLSNNKYVAKKENGNDDIVFTKKEDSNDEDSKNDYEESILVGNKPVLNEGLIPVTIENDGTASVADTSSEWYNYENKLWANAVIVKTTSNSKYKTSGTKISDTDILGYFVWIPRYKYKIKTSGTSTQSSIDILFENCDTKKSNGNAKTEYFTHPGFTFGSKEVNGIWVSKFKASGSINEPKYLPNKTSFINNNVKNKFDAAKTYNNYVTNSNAHMMKNTEWAAIAYLTNSKYGINEEVRINNNSSCLTGCGANKDDEEISVSSCQIQFGKSSSYPQSTTGNISGVFDMVGGCEEIVMANYNNIIYDPEFIDYTTSGFTEMPDSEYYDYYQTTNQLTACNNGPCKGHATYETMEWYDDFYIDLDNSNPWILRGGLDSDGSAAGLFYVNYGYGKSGTSFRTVIN